jgi:hypothetical protein
MPVWAVHGWAHRARWVGDASAIGIALPAVRLRTVVQVSEAKESRVRVKRKPSEEVKLDSRVLRGEGRRRRWQGLRGNPHLFYRRAILWLYKTRSWLAASHSNLIKLQFGHLIENIEILFFIFFPFFLAFELCEGKNCLFAVRSCQIRNERTTKTRGERRKIPLETLTGERWKFSPLLEWKFCGFPLVSKLQPKGVFRVFSRYLLPLRHGISSLSSCFFNSYETISLHSVGKDARVVSRGTKTFHFVLLTWRENGGKQQSGKLFNQERKCRPKCNKQSKRKRKTNQKTNFEQTLRVVLGERARWKSFKYLSRVAPFCTFPVASPQSLRVSREQLDTPSARPTCPSCSAQIDHCSRPSGRWLCDGFLYVARTIREKKKSRRKFWGKTNRALELKTIHGCATLVMRRIRKDKKKLFNWFFQMACTSLSERS